MIFDTKDGGGDLSERPSLWTKPRADAVEAAELLWRPVSIGVLGALVAIGVSIAGFLELLDASLFCSGKPASGANIDHGLELALLAGLAVPAALFVGWLLAGDPWRLWFQAVVLLLGATALVLSVAFVALDSATYVEKNANCSFGPGKGTGTPAHVGNLYLLLAVPFALMLVGGSRLFFQALRFRLRPTADEHGRKGD